MTIEKPPTDRALTRTFPVGKRLKVTLTVPLNLEPGLRFASAEWDPAMPKKLTPKELADYHAGRDALFAELAAIRSDGTGRRS